MVPFDARMANTVGGTAEATAEVWREAMRGTSPEPFDPDEAVAGFDAGDTIVLHGLHRRVPAIDRFAYDLEREIGQLIDVNAFLTPPDAQGLDPHYDHHDVVILQVEGTKHWTLWEASVENPLPEYAPDQFEVRGAPWEVSLEPGDVLYIPRGWTHAATTSSWTSLHLTVGMIPLPWLEVAHSFLASIDRDPMLRRSLPLGYHRDPSTLTDGLAESVERVRSVIEACDLEVSVKELAASVRARRSTRVGRLVEVVGSRAPLSADTQVVLGSRASDTIRRLDAVWRIRIDHLTFDLPPGSTPAMDVLHGGGVVALCELVGDLEGGADRLARQLLRHGVLALADHGAEFR